MQAKTSTGDPYSTIWFGYDDSFKLNNVTYNLQVSDLGEKVQIVLKNSIDDSVLVMNINDCHEDNIYEFCFVDSEKLSNEELRVQAEFYEKLPNVSFSITPTTQTSVFAGEQVELEYELKVGGDILPNNVNIELNFPNSVDAKSSFLTKEETVGGYRLFNINNNIYREYTLTGKITIDSNEVQDYDVIVQINYSSEGRDYEIFSDAITVSYKSHYSQGYKFGKRNLSKDFEFNLTLKNIAEKEVELENIEVMLPKGLTIETPTGYILDSEIYDIDSQLYDKYFKKLSLEVDEEIVQEFKLNPKIPLGNYSVIVGGKYNYDNKEYVYYSNNIDFEVEELPVEANETEQPDLIPEDMCDGDDFIITDTIPEEDDFYPGNDLKYIIYAQSNVGVNITNVAVSLLHNDILLGNKYYDLIPSKHKKNIYSYDDKVPIIENSYDMNLIVKYRCQGSSESFVQNKSFSIPVRTIDDILIQKTFASEELKAGEKTKVTVELENSGEVSVTGVLVEEEIPEGFEVSGVTKSYVTLKSESTDEAYSYYITAPANNEDTDYLFKTKVQYSYGEKNFEKEHEKIINVKKTSLSEVDFSYSGYTSGYVNEPMDIEFKIKNEDVNFIENATIAIPISKEYNLENKDFIYNKIFPNQEVIFNTKIIPLSQISRINDVLLSYKNKFGVTERKKINISTDLKKTRTNFPKLSYKVDVTEKLSKEYVLRIIISNPSTIAAKIKPYQFSRFEKESELEVGSMDTIEKEYYVDSSFMDFTNSTNLFTYSFLGTEYKLFPEEYSVIVEKPLSSTDESEKEDFSEKEDIVSALEEERDFLLLPQLDKGSFIFPTIFVYLIVFIVLFSSAIFVQNIIKEKTQERPGMSEKELNSILNTKVAPTKIMKGLGDTSYRDLKKTVKKSSLFKNEKEIKEVSESKDKKASEQTIKDIHMEPSNLFTFDEYEKYKTDLHEKIKKHKEEPKEDKKESKEIFDKRI